MFLRFGPNRHYNAGTGCRSLVLRYPRFQAGSLAGHRLNCGCGLAAEKRIFCTTLFKIHTLVYSKLLILPIKLGGVGTGSALSIGIS